MEVFVRGARSSAQDWARAQRTPISEIPPLDEKQKAEALRGNVSEEAYARNVYAEHLTQQNLLQKMLRFGRWLNEKVEERNPDCHIETVELDTWGGRLQIRVISRREIVDFEIDEELVDRFMTTGSAELEKSIYRLLEINLPPLRVARAS